MEDLIPQTPQVESWAPQWAVSFWEFLSDRWFSSAELETYPLVIAASVALVLASVPLLWRFTRQAATIIHELGHALVARLAGRRLHGIKLHSDTSGVMISSGRASGIGLLLVFLAGYPAPSVLAAVLALGYSFGFAGAVLTLYQAVLALSLLLARNAIGLISMLISLAVTGVIWVYGDAAFLSFTVAILAVFYSVAGLRCMVDVLAVHLRTRKTHGDSTMTATHAGAATTDAAQAASVGLLPAAVWLLSFFIVGIISVAVVAEAFIFGA